MTTAHTVVLGFLLFAAGAVRQAPPTGARPADAGVCVRCGWKAPGGRTISVKNIGDLERAIGDVKSGETILLADGSYPLRRPLDIATAKVTIRSASGDPSRVILHGRGMTGDTVGVALSISAADVTIADVTVREVGAHGIQVRGEAGASRFTLHNGRIEDTGQQLLKGSVSTEQRYADDGLVACSEFSYKTSAPSNYTNGVDLLATKGWHIRDNRFVRIRGPQSENWSSGPAILLWQGAEDTLVERNVIIDSFRGIAFGLTTEGRRFVRAGARDFDHRGGAIRNNVIVNLNAWADEAIEANAAVNATIDHNTVLVEGQVDWSIAVRFSGAFATIRNNLTNKRILLRDRGQAQTTGNVDGATRAWFVDPAKADLHLTDAATRAFGAGVQIPEVPQDFDRRPRAAGSAPDAGAFQRKVSGAARQVR